MNEEKIVFYNERKQKLVGLLALPKNKKPPVVVMIHGFAGTKDYPPFFNACVKPLTEAGFAILKIDCRGSGESDLEFKDTTLKSESEDVLTTLDYVKKLNSVNSNKIALIGMSLGCAVILLSLKNNRDIKTLIFWNPVINIKNDPWLDSQKHRASVKKEGFFSVRQAVGTKEFTASRAFFYEMIHFDASKYFQFVQVPILFVRGLKDRKERIGTDKNNVRGLKASYEVIEDADHIFRSQHSQKQLVEITLNWLKKHLK